MSSKLGVFLVGCAAIALPSSAVALAAGDPEPAATPETGTGTVEVVPPPPAPTPATPAQPAAGSAVAPAKEPVGPTPEADQLADEQPGAQQAKPKPRGRRAKKSPTARAAADGSVTIRDFKFSPKTISVDVGDSVTWTNRDSEPHTATDSGNFDTGTLRRGESGSATFDTAGTFNYICTIHPYMKGTVRVASAGGGGSGGGSGSSGGGDSAGASGSGSGSGSGNSSGDSSSGGSGDTGADGGNLASTGLNLWPLTLIGVAMLAAGIRLRRRVEIGD